jgi:hypothetical protein
MPDPNPHPRPGFDRDDEWGNPVSPDHQFWERISPRATNFGQEPVEACPVCGRLKEMCQCRY